MSCGLRAFRWRFDDANARVFRGDVGRSELRSVYLLVYTRPRGLAQFAHVGPLQPTASRGAKGTASAVGAAAAASVRPVVREDALDAVVAGWSLETWRTRAQAFLNGRQSDVDATTRVTVTAGEAELLHDSEPAKAAS